MAENCTSLGGVGVGDMAEDYAIDINNKAIFGADHITISGKLIEDICGCSEHFVDVPGVILALKAN